MQIVLVTGAAGFIGRNLVAAFRRFDDLDVRCHDVDSDATELRHALAQADVVYHLAGVNRPPTDAEFTSGNVEFTRWVCDRLHSLRRAPKIVFASSIQAVLDSPYGRSKAAAERTLREFANRDHAEVAIYRLPNVFGKWCRPNYNSVVATFCHRLARGESIEISDPRRELELVYIDDVVEAFAGERLSRGVATSFKKVAVSHRVTLARLAAMIQAFQASRQTLAFPDLADPFARKLYATFLSHVPERELAYPLVQKADARGALAEFLKSDHLGQIFVSRTRPGVTRGGHYHHTKAEKFLVLEGHAMIRLQGFDSRQVIEIPVAGQDFRVVDIPPGYAHSIENTGSGELVVLFWASEVFDPARPDTYSMPVEHVAEEAHEGNHDRRHAA